MSNHIHLIWQPKFGFEPIDIQSSFMKYTAHLMKYKLENENPDYLLEFQVNKGDRKFQFWKREALSVELFTASVFQQKLDYIHNNPVQAGLCFYPENYQYSSAELFG